MRVDEVVADLEAAGIGIESYDVEEMPDAPVRGSTYEAARWLVEQRKLSVIPVESGGKRPAVKWTDFQTRRPTERELLRWFGNGQRRNLGIICGAVSEIVAIDCDSPAAMAWADRHLPTTAMRTRTARGEHRFYRHPGVPVRNAARIRTDDGQLALDVRADGGFVIGPTSVHESGAVYERAGEWPPVSELPTFDPAWLEPAADPEPATEAEARRMPSGDRRMVVHRARAYLAATPPAVEGQAGDAHTFQVCCRLVRGFDLSDDEAMGLLRPWNARCAPPWADEELRAKVEAARKYGGEPIGGRANRPMVEPVTDVPVVAVGASAQDRLTEAGAAERLARLHSADVRFDHRRGRWLLWRGHRWAPDVDAAITRLALEFARTWQREAVEIADRDRREAAFKMAIKLERRDALLSMLKLAADLRPIADAGDGWDANPWLLGTPNGVVDLRTGNLRAGSRDDRITLATGIAFDPDAESSLWTSTLASILMVDTTIDFLQAALGYSATGDTRRDCWFLACGSGRNGKGTIYHPVRRALGDYSAELPAAVLDARRDSAPYDLAVLPGRRFVISSEAGDTIKLHHDRVKQVTGGDPIRAANKYEKSFEFQPACKLWLAANKKPRVTDDSPAFWARVMLIPFEVSFAGREDRDLRPTLEHEPEHQAAILAWVVRGAVRYVTEGLHPTSIITNATAQFEHESDPIADFMDDACERDAEAEIGAADLYTHYKDWANRHGLTERERLTSTAFGRRMGGLFEKQRVRTGTVYRGLARRVGGGA